MIRDRDIICISSIDWDFVWQGHQEIMSTFARNNNRVLYIENTGIRAPRLSDLKRLKHRIINWRKGISGIRQEDKNLFICSPLILPFPYSRVAKLINRYLLINNIKIWTRAVGFKDIIIWTFLPTAVTLDIIDNIDHGLVVYYCIAEFAELVTSSRKLNRCETSLLKHCDVVFAQGEKIKERCQKYNSNVHIFPFGVRSDVFSKPIDETHQPSDIRSVRKPILGYIGGIHKHIDFNLLKTLALQNPESSVVLVGPVQTEKAENLKVIKNIYFLGKKDHSELPYYVDAFDICLIPYVINEYTKTVYPTKLNEYLMRGKRVLSTPLPEISKFVQDFGNVVYISENEEDFLKKTQDILNSPKDEALSKKAAIVASQNTWEKRIEEMSALIELAMDKKQKEISSRWMDNFVHVLKIAKKKALTLTSTALIFYLLTFHTPLLWWVAKPLKVTSTLAKADVIIALGGGVGETGRAGQGYEERVKHAIELYNKDYAKKIIFSSGFVYAFKEPDVMKALAVSLGVSPSDIILEKEAKNTYENIKNSLSIAESFGFKRIIFISSPYHMLRLKMVSYKIGSKDNYFIYSPIPYSVFFGDGKHVHLRHIKAILHEYLAIIYYLLKGYA